jgi:hypothetical protein
MRAEDKTSRRPARIRVGRPAMATHTDTRSGCLVEESSAGVLTLQVQGGDAPRGGGAGS